MFPSALAMPAPIPFVVDLTLTFGPVLLVIVLALLDISAVAVLHAALVGHHRCLPSSNAHTGPTGHPIALGAAGKTSGGKLQVQT